MKLFLKITGCVVLILVSLYLSGGYKRFIKKRIAEYEGLVALLSHLEEKISHFLSFGEELWRDFRNEEMEKCGLLPLLRGGEPIHSAFEKCKDRLSIAKSASQKVYAELRRLGKGYLENEIQRVSEIKQALEGQLSEEISESEKNAKIADALIFGAAAALIIIGL